MTYEKPTVTYVGSDPKLPALKKAINRVAAVRPFLMLGSYPGNKRFVDLWKCRNRRVRVLMFKVRQANNAR